MASNQSGEQDRYYDEVVQLSTQIRWAFIPNGKGKEPKCGTVDTSAKNYSGTR
jgi:hypothetical protein